MNKKILLDKLIKYFDESIEIPDDLDSKRKLYNQLLNANSSKLDNVSRDILETEDKLLRYDLINSKLTDGTKLKSIKDSLGIDNKYSNFISLWKGDITSIYTDVIVNPTNNDSLNCTFNDMNSLDYKIFCKSGMRLRKKTKLIALDSKLDVTDITITRGYNIVCDCIIHLIAVNKSMEDSSILLRMSYLNVLECAKNNMSKVIVIPKLGIGFSSEEEYPIALSAIYEFLDKYSSMIDRIVLQVDDDKDYDLCKNLLGKEIKVKEKDQ